MSPAPYPLRLAAGWACLLLVAGCGDPFPLAPVSGQIKIGGRPAANVHVSFEPIGSDQDPVAGPGSIGVTDAEGRYRLTTAVEDYEGAVVGEHRVRIALQQAIVVDELDRRYKGLPAAAEVKQLPEEYNDRTTLRFAVPAAGTDSADFDLPAP